MERSASADVRERGVEPLRPKAPGPKPGAAACYATPASGGSVRVGLGRQLTGFHDAATIIRSVETSRAKNIAHGSVGDDQATVLVVAESLHYFSRPLVRKSERTVDDRPRSVASVAGSLLIAPDERIDLSILIGNVFAKPVEMARRAPQKFGRLGDGHRGCGRRRGRFWAASSCVLGRGTFSASGEGRRLAVAVGTEKPQILAPAVVVVPVDVIDVKNEWPFIPLWTDTADVASEWDTDGDECLGEQRAGCAPPVRGSNDEDLRRRKAVRGGPAEIMASPGEMGRIDAQVDKTALDVGMRSARIRNAQDPEDAGNSRRLSSRFGQHFGGVFHGLRIERRYDKNSP